MKTSYLPPPSFGLARFTRETRLRPRARRSASCAIGGLFLLLAFLVNAAESEHQATAGSVSFIQAPEGSRSFILPLSVLETPGSRPQGYLAQRSPESATETTDLPPTIKNAYPGKEFSAFDIAKLPDGTRYLLVLHEDKAVKFLNRNEQSFLYARVYRLGPGPDAQPEIVREGFQSPGNDVTIPVEIDIPEIGITKVKKLRTEVGYSLGGLNNGRPSINTGRGQGLQVTGSQVIKEGKLTLTLNVPDDLKVASDTLATLRFEPVTSGLPERIVSGKISDYLTLGPARFVLTSLAPDFSQATLAVAAGSLEETLKQQLQVGTQMPPFSQVDLLTRKTVTRDEVLGKAKSGAPVFFVFGDLPTPRSPYGPYYSGGPGMGGSLPMPPAEVADQLALELKPKPVVVFVTRQIGLDFLYGDLRNKTPDYLVLADFADPLRTTFRPPPGPGSYGGPAYPMPHEPSLRQLFNLPDRSLSIVAFESSGKVVYVKADAGRDFLVSLGEARVAARKK